MEALELQNPTTESEWEELLSECAKEARQSSEEAGSSLSDMLGGFKPLSVILGRACSIGLYAKKPKLRQRLLMADDTQEFVTDTASNIVHYLCRLVAHCVYRRTGAEFNPVSADDLLDELNDENEARKLCEELLGMDFNAEKGGSPSTDPITEKSSVG